MSAPDLAPEIQKAPPTPSAPTSDDGPARPADAAPSAPARTAGDSRIPLLDGVRAVAIGMVFAAHAGLDTFVPGGFGVTVFFFLSGFLITSLLKRERDKTGTINFKAYYLRRILRIWPPMYIFLGVVALLAGLGAMGFDDLNIAALLAQACHFGNYYQIFHESTFFPGTGVLWSLAVEEHFYLVYPFVLWLVLRRWKSGTAVGVMLAACLATLAWRYWLVSHGSSENRTYKGSDTRLDSLLFGCVLGLIFNVATAWCRRQPTWRIAAILAPSFALLLATFAIRNPHFRETLRYTLQGVAIFPIFAFALSFPKSAWCRWLDNPVLTHLGTISYSIYLFHYTAIQLGRYYIGNPWVTALVALVAALAAAEAMYHWVEKPCADLRKRLHHSSSSPAKQAHATADRHS